MSKAEIDSFNDQIRKGLELAEYRMLREKALRNQSIIQGDGRGGVREVSARDIFTKLYNEPIPTY